MEDLPQLTSAETAARLGVKPASLYAYVARGLLTRTRTAHGSRFDALEVERFARSRRRADPVGVVPGSPLMVLDTDIAHIEDGNLYFRGEDAIEVTRERTFEQVARWLWGLSGGTSARDDAAAFSLDEDALAAARAVADTLPSESSLARMQAAVLALSARGTAQSASTPEDAVRAGEMLLAVLPRCLGGPDDQPAQATVAEMLAVVLGGGRPESDALVRIIDRALALAVDHDLAVSTLAARIAASARGSAYTGVLAALAAFDSPLHGTVSRDAVRLLRRVQDGQSVARALAATGANSSGVPGFGHRIYRGADPRAVALLDDLARLDGGEVVLRAVAEVSAEVAARAGLHPNIDLALAALVIAGDLREDAGVVLFGTGRVVGWIAHIVDEYRRPSMRLRPQGRYVGP